LLRQSKSGRFKRYNEQSPCRQFKHLKADLL